MMKIGGSSKFRFRNDFFGMISEKYSNYNSFWFLVFYLKNENTGV